VYIVDTSILSVSSVVVDIVASYQKHGLAEGDAEDIEQYHMEIRNTAVTLLMIALIIPEFLVFLSHFFKSLFGSQPWPTMRIVLMVCTSLYGGFRNKGLVRTHYLLVAALLLN